ncbi:FAD-dependent monooxygenase [Kitasatospora sp. NPDC089509]|uniref:FAD-dependent monooxygenase n=1 Tax=Kitasatospora sp. NPDC089509 TaxID=3364079 RepID=UPI003827D5B0
MNHDTQVIVVGAGPVGLLLAAELRLAGAETIVLEQVPRPSPRRRAPGIGPLAFEALQRRGLELLLALHRWDDDDAPEDAHRKAKGKSRGRGKRRAKAKDAGAVVEPDRGNGHFARIGTIDPALQEEPERRGRPIGQSGLEAALRAHAENLGVRIRQAHTVTGLRQDDRGVTVSFTAGTVSPPQSRSCRAPYLVGCDGHLSTVRELAGFDFPGTGPLVTGRRARADLVSWKALPPTVRTPHGTVLHGGGSVEVYEPAVPHSDHQGPITAEELEGSARRAADARVFVTRFTDAVSFTDHAHQVTDYRNGRILLAGDAAHVHSPGSGQGLDLGLLDAVALGWRLAAVVREEAPEGLLDGYTAERHPVAAAVLHNARAQSALLLPGPHTEALRSIVADLMDFPEVNRYFGRLLSGLDTRYDLPYAPAEPHPRFGRPAPDLLLDLPGGASTRLSRLTTGGGFLLLAPPGSPALAAARARLDDRLRAREVTAIHGENLSAALIRPDGVIAWTCRAGGTPDLALLGAALAAWLG